LGRKQKIMAAIVTAAEGLNLAADLLTTIQKRSAIARKRTGRIVSNLRDSTADVAEQLVDTVNKRLRPRRSAASRALPFAAGVGVGVGAALLFAPMPGAKMRENLYKKVAGSDRTSRETRRTDWAVHQ
jgi:hypothetical protein